MPQEFIIEGRIVWGHPSKSQNKQDDNGKDILNAEGKPIPQWVFGLAVEKAKFGAQAWPHMVNEVRTVFPSYDPATGQGIPPKFSFKYKDGDTDVDQNGKPYREYEGRAGCYILTVATESFAPNVYKLNAQGRYDQIDSSQIKCGDYVAVSIMCKFNGQQSPKTPGLYINPQSVIHIGYGTEIVSQGGKPPEQLFAGYTPTLPPGATATPTMTATPGGLPPGMNAPQAAPAAPQTYAAPAPAPMQHYAPAAPVSQPGAMPPPAPDFVANAGMPPANFGAPGAVPPTPGMPAPAPTGYAPGATSYPTNGMPPSVPQR